MKKIILIIILIISLNESRACDICGCSAENYFIGPFPHFKSHFLGTRYSFRSFHSQMADDPTQFSKDLYQTIEIWGGINLGKKWQLMLFVPYNINRQLSDDGKKTSNGFGDITLFGNYKFINKHVTDAHHNKISHQLLLGGGIKVPTGKLNSNPDEIIAGANNQPGTGSVDFLLNATYAFQFNHWGVNANANYKINQSAQNFQFGNRFSASTFISHSFETKFVGISPNVGVLYENLQANQLNHAKVAQTGGYAALGSLGVELDFHSVTVGMNTQLPLGQKLSDGQTSSIVRGMLHVTFSF